MKAELYPDDNIDIRTYYSTPRSRPWIKWVILGCVLLLLAIGVFIWHLNRYFYPDIILENDQLCIFEYNGQRYLRFQRSDEPFLKTNLLRTSKYKGYSHNDYGVHFGSVEEMHDAIVNGTLTKSQIGSAESLPRDEYGIYIFDVENLYDVVLPSQVQTTGIKWHGEGYSIKLNAGDYPLSISVYINENMSFSLGMSSISYGYRRDNISLESTEKENDNQESAFHRVYDVGGKETLSAYQKGNNWRGIVEYNGSYGEFNSISVSYKAERICWYAVVKRTDFSDMTNREYASTARQWAQAIDVVPLATAG